MVAIARPLPPFPAQAPYNALPLQTADPPTSQEVVASRKYKVHMEMMHNRLPNGRGADDFATAIAYEHAVARAFLDGGAGDGHIPPWAVALQNSLGALRGEVAAVRGEVGHIRVSLQRTELYAAQARNGKLREAGSDVITPLPGVDGKLAPAGFGAIHSRQQIQQMVGMELKARLLHLDIAVPPHTDQARKDELLALHYLSP